MFPAGFFPHRNSLLDYLLSNNASLTVVRHGHRLVFQLRPVPHQHAHEEAIHVHVKDHPRLPSPQRPSPEDRLGGAGQGTCRKSCVYDFHRVRTPEGTWDAPEEAGGGGGMWDGKGLCRWRSRGQKEGRGTGAEDVRPLRLQSSSFLVQGRVSAAKTWKIPRVSLFVGKDQDIAWRWI